MFCYWESGNGFGAEAFLAYMGAGVETRVEMGVIRLMAKCEIIIESFSADVFMI